MIAERPITKDIKECDEPGHWRCAALALTDGSYFHRPYSPTGASPYYASEQTVTWYVRGYPGHADDHTLTIPWTFVVLVTDHHNTAAQHQDDGNVKENATNG